MQRLQRNRGPQTAVAARKSVGFESPEGWLVERPSGGGAVVSEVPVCMGTIAVGDHLEWVWFPERTLPAEQHEPREADLDRLWAATAFTLDVVFTDGERASTSAVDQYGVMLDPRAQAEARMTWVDQWNRRCVDLSAFAGKSVERIEAIIGEDDPGGPSLRGWLDGVRIAPAPRRLAGGLSAVDTRRGTHSSGRFSRGNTAPLVGVPHGGVFGLPMTDAGSASWPYAYQEHNRPRDNRPALQAFATSHLPSPWIGDRGVFQVMPSPSATPDTDRNARALGFDRADEIARPHHYRVALEHGVCAEMTAGDFAIGWRFRFEQSDSASIVLDHHGTVRSATVGIIDGTAVVDLELDDLQGSPVHFIHLRIQRAMQDRTRFRRGRFSGFITLDATADVDVRLGISTVSPADAAANLEAAGSFEAMLTAARSHWEEKLATVSVEGATEDQLTSLYSGLYRVFLYPMRAGECALAGTPRHHSFTGSDIVDAAASTTNGFWDTYRTAWPLLALLTPHDAGELAQGFVEHFRESGWVPRWSAPGPVDSMTGTTSDTVFGDLVTKGIDGFSLDDAYRSAVKNATVPSTDPRVGRKGIRPGAFRGYVDTLTPEGMSWTLDAAINDWSIAVMARALADRADAAGDTGSAARYEAEWEWFARRSLQYRHVFDRSRGFFIGRRPDGEWRVGNTFDPAVWGGDYTETNAWGTMFTAPHDGAGVVALHGGPDAFVAALRRFFAERETGGTDRAGSYGFAIHEMTEARDVRMGMLGLSNQPAHHIPFFPMFAGRHDDAHRIVRECLQRLFVGSDLGQGYPGDEDNGEMSAWYVFAAIGLYPLAPATGSYVIVPPLFRRTTIAADGGATTVIDTVPGTHGPYIASVTVNGEPWDRIDLPHSLLAAGAHIVIALSEEPCGWASESRPLSASELHGFRDPADDVLPADGSALTDDVGTSTVAIDAGAFVDLPVSVTSASLYTVTVEAAGSFGWTVAWVGADGSVRAIGEEREALFEWNGQTRVFRLSGGVRDGAIRFTAVTPLRLAQIEVIATSAR